MADLFLRQNGEFDTESMYSFEVPFIDVVDVEALPEGTIVAPNVSGSKGRVRGQGTYYMEIVGGSTREKFEYDCPADKTHLHPTRSWYDTDEYECDLFGGPTASPLTYLMDHIAVTKPIKRQLEASGLKGISFAPITFVEGVKPGAPDFFAWRFTGKNCTRAKSIRKRPNACPWCGREPLICPVCQTEFSVCPKCRKSCFIAESARTDPDDPRYTFLLEETERPILEGRLWDGSDFFGLGWKYATRRAIDWLLSIHAEPFIAKPVRLNKTGMTEQQLEQLAAARKPVPTK